MGKHSDAWNSRELRTVDGSACPKGGCLWQAADKLVR